MTQRKQDREAVKVLAISVGVREAARQLGLNEERVMKWSQREGWLKQPEPKPQPPTVTRNEVRTVRKPSDALAGILEERKDKSKLHLSKYVTDASAKASESNGNLKLAPRVRDVAAIHSTLWPEKEQQGNGVMPGLNIYSERTVIAVQTHEDGKQE